MPEIGLVLRLVDVTTDCLDLLAHVAIHYVVNGRWAIDEMTAKNKEVEEGMKDLVDLVLKYKLNHTSDTTDT